MGAAGLVLAVLLGSVQLALVVPGEERLPPLAGSRPLERSTASPGSFSQLRDGFVDRVLGLGGLEFGAPASEMGRDRRGFDAAGGGVAGRRDVVSHGLTNDDVGDAFVVSSIPFTAKTRTTGASRQSDEPAGCAPAGGTVWYRYRATDDGVLVATTFGTNYSTALAVFARGPAEPRPLGCDIDPVGNAQVVFPASAGESYLFQVTGPAGGGDLVFNLDPLGATSRVSVSATQRESDEGSWQPSISADGQLVAFDSASSSLVDEDTNTCFPYDSPAVHRGPGHCSDVFVHDRVTGITERVSVASSGKQANGYSGWPAISGDGRHVAFYSLASNLVEGDTNGQWDVFVHDRLMGRTTRASVSSTGQEGRPLPFSGNDAVFNAPSMSLSFDGRYVGFASTFPNLVPNDGNACTDAGIVNFQEFAYHPEPPHHVHGGGGAAYGCRDIFVHDRTTRITTRVSVSSSGTEADGDSSSTYLSPDGRYVVFASDAANLVDDDENGYRDVFVHDRARGTTELVSVGSSDAGNGNSGGTGVRGHATISADGRYVAFISFATNLVPDDPHPFDEDVFLRDRVTGTTVLLSRAFLEDAGDDAGTIVRASGHHATISGDGRFVAFSSEVVVVRAGETQSVRHVFVHDRLAAATTRVSVSSAGLEANGYSAEPDISADGRAVAFWSEATNLVDGDTNGMPDVFVHDLPWAR